ncbi:branched-chain amino acid ABC transporter permease [Shimia sediminis]|uniref:branched-chain amino acid ABC transporter permease n=1 Tax=Shimia sediminis TaxID=2497945 RepID=UPI0013DFD4E0|nr:branched-chain amino acid ABC transporter permease [Shimia sediminis]
MNSVQIITDALSLGGIYALTALGIGLVFSVLRLANFAHAELVTVAGYALLIGVGLPLPLVLFMAAAASVLVAMATERLAFRPLRHVDQTTMLVSSFAVSILIQNIFVFFSGSRAKGVDILPALARQVSVLGADVSMVKLTTIAVCGATLVGLISFLRFTRLGLEMRAASQDFSMARNLGVRADRVILIAFALSGILAAVVGVLFVAEVGFVQPRLGLQLVIISFVGTVIGGLGNLTGAMVGGFLIGFIATLLQTFLPLELREFREAFLFGIVILILLVRPHGLFPARHLKERV